MNTLELLEGNQWHDLRKNPKDLPSIFNPFALVLFSPYEASMGSFEYSVADYSDREWHLYDYLSRKRYPCEYHIIAWMELPQFKE